jgi:hypothetical protein
MRSLVLYLYLLPRSIVASFQSFLVLPTCITIHLLLKQLVAEACPCRIDHVCLTVVPGLQSIGELMHSSLNAVSGTNTASAYSVCNAGMNICKLIG